mgnify:FL=1
MKIGILTTGHIPDQMAEIGNYEAQFRRLLDGQGFDFVNYNVVDGDFPASVVDAEGWLITGSKHGAYEDHPWIPPLEDFIRGAYEAGVPLVGVCFGHQIVAQALGGKVEKFKDGWSLGRTEYDFGGETLALNAWHQDQVVEKPALAETVASTDFCAHAALVYGDRAFTVQPHPEFESEFIGGLIEARGGVVPADLVAVARDNLDKPNSNAVLAERIGRFFRERRLA